ncbi:unnamed protein product, partial [Mesorhabditis belari]|uniref:MATH domain-containing protein n=1 Tax=Mesorhabditis belari TaxID=2138241 RepID=A0AAF3J823_9BILA
MHDEGGEAGGSCGHSAAQHDDPSGATAQQMLNDSISEGISSPHECGGSTTRKESSPFARFPRYSHDLRHHPPCGHNLRSKRLNGISVACQTDSTDEFPREQNLLAVRAAQTEASSSSSEGINGVQWKIMVMPRQHVVQKKGTQKCLGFFLQCCPDAYSDAWQCQASAELRLISQKPGVNHFTRKTNHIYTAKENDWGYSCFMTWADILEEDQGYIKDGRVVLEVSVKADTPKNILTYEDFQKQIQSWYDLAELQQQRGFIDLALEANAQALKFCKDRDAAIKERLEEQKKFFVERKLVESIQRIEQKGTLTSVPDDENASQNAVRLALTQNTAQKIPAVKGGKNGKKNPTNKKKNRASTPPGNPPTENKDDSKDGDEKVDVKSGRFSKNVLLRGHREDSYANLAKQFYEMPPEAIQLDEQDTRDGLSYMFDQLFHVARLDYPNKFNSTPLDMELQRQLIIKKATMESTEDRAFIIEKNMGWLDAKVRLFWLEDDCSFSDGASCSSESDSGSGDGPQLKRSRCDVDERCDHCILAEKLEQLYFVGPKNRTANVRRSPSVRRWCWHKMRPRKRIQPLAKQCPFQPGKAAANAQVISQQLAAMQQAQLTQPPIPPPTSMMPPPHEMLDASQFVQGLAAAHLASMPPPPGLSTEDLEKQFRECTNEMQVDESTNEFLKHTFARVWTMMRGFDDQTSQLNPEVPNVYEGNLYNPYPGQVLPNQQVNIALSVIAVIRNPDVQTALRSLCKLGDMVVVEDDEDSGSPLHNEDKHGGEDYLLSRHLARLDNLQQKAEKYAYYIHNKDGERLMQAVAAVEQKFLTLEKEKVKMQKQVEEHKKEVEKAEKTLTKHLSELRQEKDIKDKLNNQLKEKNKEIKKFEKRIKELTVMAEEKDEAGSTAQQQTFLASRDEWKGVLEEIQRMVEKPPPAPKIITIPSATPAAIPTQQQVVLPPEPPKASPGVIAPGSPIQKPVATVASQPQTASPCRHPGAIGSRANGNEATPSTAAAPGTASNLNMGGSWHWNDFSLSDNLLGNRGFGPLTDNFSASASTSTNPAPTTTTHATTTNGWSGDGWNQKTPTAPPPHTAAPGAPIQQNQRITQKYGGEEAFKHQTILEQVSEIFRHVEKKKLVNLSNEYCYQNQTNFQHEPIPIAVKILEKYITQKLNNETNDASNRRVMGTPIQPPPGVTPSYMNMGPLSGLDMPIRQTPNQMMGTYNTMMDNSLLNGDATRSVIGADKWSLQNL